MFGKKNTNSGSKIMNSYNTILPKRKEMLLHISLTNG